MEQIFRPVEISLINHLLSSYAWQPFVCLVETSCTNAKPYFSWYKLQSVTKTMVKTTIWATSCFYPLLFFSDITASESNFYISRKHIFQRILYFGQWALIFCLVETVCYYSELFFLLETITVGTYLKRKTLPSSWNHLLWFSFQKKQRLLPVKAFLLSSGNVFLNESFIPAIGEGLSLSCGNRLCDKFFLLAESVTDMSGNQFLKTNLILATENRYFLACGNHFLHPG